MPTQAPTLMRPKRGIRNQKIESCEPRRRSFFVKSIADSVAFTPQPKNPVDAGFAGAVLDIVKEIAKKVSASIRMGIEDLRQRSNDSANVMKMPATGEKRTKFLAEGCTYQCHRTRRTVSATPMPLRLLERLQIPFGSASPVCPYSQQYQYSTKHQ